MAKRIQKPAKIKAPSPFPTQPPPASIPALDTYTGEPSTNGLVAEALASNLVSAEISSLEGQLLPISNVNTPNVECPPVDGSIAGNLPLPPTEHHSVNSQPTLNDPTMESPSENGVEAAAKEPVERPMGSGEPSKAEITLAAEIQSTTENQSAAECQSASEIQPAVEPQSEVEIQSTALLQLATETLPSAIRTSPKPETKQPAAPSDKTLGGRVTKRISKRQAEKAARKPPQTAVDTAGKKQGELGEHPTREEVVKWMDRGKVRKGQETIDAYAQGSLTTEELLALPVPDDLLPTKRDSAQTEPDRTDKRSPYYIKPRELPPDQHPRMQMLMPTEPDIKFNEPWRWRQRAFYGGWEPNHAQSYILAGPINTYKWKEEDEDFSESLHRTSHSQ